MRLEAPDRKNAAKAMNRSCTVAGLEHKSPPHETPKAVHAGYNAGVNWPAIGVVACILLYGGEGVAQGDPHDPAGRQERAARLRAQGEALLAAGDPGSALAYFRDAVAVHPGDAESFAAIGEIYLARGNAAYAVEAFTAGLRRRADVASLWLGLARALQAGGHPEEAATALRSLVQRQPRNRQAHEARAALAEVRGAWSEALASYRALLELLRATGGSATHLDVTNVRAKISALRVLTGEAARASRCTPTSPVQHALGECLVPR